MTITRTRSRWRAALALVALAALLAGACGGDDDSSSDGGDDGGGGGSGETIVFRPQDFAESVTLTEVYAQYVAANGYDTEVQQPDGAFREGVYPALEGGDADVVIDYTGSAATFLDPEGTPSPDPDETYERLEASLTEGLVAAAYSPSEDKNALVVLKTFAEENDLTTISDLASVQDEVTFGGSAQCIEREDCLLGYQGDTYGLTFADVKTLEYGPPLAAGLLSGDIQAAQYQTTAPEIASGDFVILEDDKGLLSADNIVPVLGADAGADDDLIALLDELSEQITTDDLIEWNVATDIDKEESVDVATAWLEEKGLL